MPMRAFEWALRLGLGALFIVAGVLKLRDPTGFATEIANYRFLAEAAPWLAATLPMVEVILGAALIAAPALWRRGAALAMAGLLVVFTVAVTQAVARGINVDCGCFGGAASGPVSGWTIARDLGLLAASVALLWLTPRPAASNS
jgi:putative oxidoreductase